MAIFKGLPLEVFFSPILKKCFPNIKIMATHKQFHEDTHKHLHKQLHANIKKPWDHTGPILFREKVQRRPTGMNRLWSEGV